MAKRTTRAPRRPKRMTASPENIAKAINELGIDKPYARVRVVGNRLELSLYGGDVVYWPATASRAKRTAKGE